MTKDRYLHLQIPQNTEYRALLQPRTVACLHSATTDAARSRITQRFCLLYEKETEQNKYETGIAAVEFDLEWLVS